MADKLLVLSLRRACLWANLVLAVAGTFTFVAVSLLDTAALSLINPATPTTAAPASAAMQDGVKDGNSTFGKKYSGPKKSWG
jgi:hypothetical protein